MILLVVLTQSIGDKMLKNSYKLPMFIVSHRKFQSKNWAIMIIKHSKFQHKNRLIIEFMIHLVDLILSISKTQPQVIKIMLTKSMILLEVLIQSIGTKKIIYIELIWIPFEQILNLENLPNIKILFFLLLI